MSTVVVVGTQWGDEGKGKITDYLAESAEVVLVTKAETMLVIRFSLTVKSTS